MLYKKDNNSYWNSVSATAKVTIVNKLFKSLPDYVDGSYCGPGASDYLLYEFGFNLLHYKLNSMENVSAENILNKHANYLEENTKLDVDYYLNIVLEINRYLSANSSVEAI